MHFKLIEPCDNCPFLSNKPFPLAEGRVEEIIESISVNDQSFPCHKTTTGENGGRNEQHCAGALIFLEKENNPNQMMRIAERLGRYDHTKLNMNISVYKSEEDMIKGCLCE